MTTDLSTELREAMEQNLAALVAYARRTMVDGEPLTPLEESEKSLRMKMYLGMGTSFQCTKRELVELLYRGLFEPARGCDCVTCLARKSDGLPASGARGRVGLKRRGLLARRTYQRATDCAWSPPPDLSRILPGSLDPTATRLYVLD